MVSVCREAKKGAQNNNGGQQGKKKFQNPEANKTVDEIRDLRADKVQTLREAGKEPFAYAFERSAAAADLQVSAQLVLPSPAGPGNVPSAAQAQ